MDPITVQFGRIGFGCYLYRGGQEIIRSAIEDGAVFVDTAELYENEQVVGEAIRGIRDKTFLATKTHHWRYAEVKRCAEASLRKLQTDRIDLYQLHWPNAAVPIAETMTAFEDLIDEGKVVHIGLSNFTVPEFNQAQKCLRKYRLFSNQMRYSLVDRTIEGEMWRFCRAQQVLLIAYSPLGHNFRNIIAADQVGVLEQVAGETGKTKAQVALNWVIRRTGIVAIPKSESAGHLKENSVAGDFRLSEDQIKRLEAGIRCVRRSRFEIALRRFVRRAAQRLRSFSPA
jgi:diketogulonate reductase-like aldo/keto reductase